MKKLIIAGLGFWLFCFPLRQSVQADGMIIPHPYRQIYETGQKAVIWWTGGREKIILSTTFEGDAEEFAWIVPVPSRPEVDKGSDEIFTSLRELTVPQTSVPGSAAGMLGTREWNTDSPSPVTVVETKKVDIYDITVLTSTESDALANWLKENDFPYPLAYAYILDEYVQNDWYFITAKIDTAKLGRIVEGQLRTGHATPLLISFATDRLVYPLKISSVVSDSTIAGEDIILQHKFDYKTDTWSAQNSRLDINTDVFNEGIGSMQVSAGNSSEYPVSALLSVNKLSPGKIYTLSAYLKPAPGSAGNTFLSVEQGGKTASSPAFSLDSQTVITGSWKRLSLTFTTVSETAVLKISGDGFGAGEAYYVDSVQLEQGNKPTDFVFTHETSPKMVPNPSDKAAEILLYVFTEKNKVTIPGFVTDYAGMVKAETIEKLAYTDQGEPLLPASDKMYLTKLHRQLKPSEMTNDLYPREAEDNRPVGAGQAAIIDVKFPVVVLAYSVPLFLEITAIVWFFQKRKI